MRVLLAGATGYLGGHIAQELKAQLIPTVLIGRNPQKLIGIAGDEAEAKVVQLTEAESVRGCCEGVDVVISTVGITRQKDGLTYREVDFQANLNLLQEAEHAGVKSFIYVSAFKGQSLRHLKIFEAKEAFVDALKASNLEGIVIRPNGFFSDMEDFLQMAAKGKVYLFGKGEQRLNPIHGADLAKVIVDVVVGKENVTELNIGGPDILTHKAIAQLAFDATGGLRKKPRVVLLPDWVRRAAIRLLRWFTPLSVSGPAEFFLTVMGEDYVAPKFGTQSLRVHFFRVSKTAQVFSNPDLRLNH